MEVFFASLKVGTWRSAWVDWVTWPDEVVGLQLKSILTTSSSVIGEMKSVSPGRDSAELRGEW